MTALAEDINRFWFGVLEQGAPVDDRSPLWFGAEPAVDDTIRQRFGNAVAEALAGGFATWEGDSRTELALVLLLDQFTRNVHRGEAAAFAGDERARRLVTAAIAAGRDTELALAERLFFYLPLEHSERLEDHDLCLERLTAVANAAVAQASARATALAESMLDFAHGHRAIVARFGRYPHRNRVLGRPDTAAERAWIEAGGARFGQ